MISLQTGIPQGSKYVRQNHLQGQPMATFLFNRYIPSAGAQGAMQGLSPSRCAVEQALSLELKEVATSALVRNFCQHFKNLMQRTSCHHFKDRERLCLLIDQCCYQHGSYSTEFTKEELVQLCRAKNAICRFLEAKNVKPMMKDIVVQAMSPFIVLFRKHSLHISALRI